MVKLENDDMPRLNHDLFQFRWAMHEKILKPLRKNAKHIHNWWEFTGRPDPGEEAILETLKRLVSGVLTHPVTIGEENRVKLFH